MAVKITDKISEYRKTIHTSSYNSEALMCCDITIQDNDNDTFKCITLDLEQVEQFIKDLQKAKRFIKKTRKDQA